MPERRTGTAATPAPDDTLRERLAEVLTAHLPGYVDGTCGCGDGTDTDVRHLTDALLPLIREHVAATVQAKRVLPSAASARFQAVRKPNGTAVIAREEPDDA